MSSFFNYLTDKRALVTTCSIGALAVYYFNFHYNSKRYEVNQVNPLLTRHPFYDIYGTLPVSAEQIEKIRKHREYCETHLVMKGFVSLSNSLNPVDLDNIIDKYFKESMFPDQFCILVQFDIDHYSVSKSKLGDISLIIRCDRDYKLVHEYLIQNNQTIQITENIKIQINVNVNEFKAF